MGFGMAVKRSVLAGLTAMALIAQAGAAENRFGVAVIIGNSNYSHERVPDVAYAHRDADAFRRYVIDVLGFREGNVIDLRDASQAQMVAAFGNEGDFKGKVYDWVRPGKSDVVVFYSGHGVPGGGSDKRGYLLPGNADPGKARLNGYPIDVLYENLSQVRANSVTVFIDACFSGDTPRGMLIQSASPVFVEATLPEAAGGLTVLTAASGAELASWDEDRQHGLFTSYVLDGLYGAADGKDFGNGDGSVTLGELRGWLDSEMTYHARRQFSRDQHATVQGDGATTLNAVPALSDWQVASVDRAAQPANEPSAEPSFSVTSMEDTLYTLKNANVRSGPGTKFEKVGRLDVGTEVEVTGQVEGADWLQIALAGQTAYIYAPLLGDRIPVPAQPAVGVFPEQPPARKPGDMFKDCDVCPEMVVLPAGSFMMGSPQSDRYGNAQEWPVHRVSIARDFAVGRYEVTLAEWNACPRSGGCNGNFKDDPEPSSFDSNSKPVSQVSWQEANDYVQWLSDTTGKRYRLLSEAEWEYAARAGTSTPWPWGAQKRQGYANCAETDCPGTNLFHNPVGSYPPNGFGLYDMIGNVSEWTADCYNYGYDGAPTDGSPWLEGRWCSRKVIRGGGGSSSLENARSSFRDSWSADKGKLTIGIRVARDLE